MELTSINVTEHVSYERVLAPEDCVISHDASIKKEKPQDLEIKLINVTDNVCYERVPVPLDHYECITDGAVRPHPIPAYEERTSTTALYHNVPSPTLSLPSFNTTTQHLSPSPAPFPSLPSSPHHTTSLSSPPPSSTPSTLPLQSGLPQPPFHHHTQSISVASFHDHVHTMHMNGNKGFQSEYHQVRCP